MPLMKTPEGVAVDVPGDQVQRALDIGYHPATPGEAAAGLTQPESGAEGVGGAALAGVTSALSGATFGGTDALIAAAAPAGDIAAVRAAREAHPIVSGVSGVAGAIAPALLTGGESLLAAPTRLVGEAGQAAARAGEAAGLGRIGGAVIGGTVEGTLFGAGQGVSELALSDDPLTIDHIASSLSSNALFGAATGGVIGGAGKAAELGLRRAKGAIDQALEKRALSKAQTPVEAIESGDLQHVDKRILDTAEKAEIARITEEQAPQRKAFTEEISLWRKANRDEHELRAVARASGDPNLSEASGAFDRANLELRKALDNKIKFAKDPVRSLEVVQRQAQALEEMSVAARAHQRAWQEAVDTAPQRFRDMLEEISNKPTLAERTKAARAAGLVDYTGPFTPAGLDTAAERAIKEYSEFQWGGAIKNGLQEPSIVSRIPRIEEMLAANQKLQAQLEAIAKPPTSDLLTKIAEARAVLEGPKPAPSGLGAVVSAVAPFAGPAGAAAAAGGRVIGSFKKLAAAVGERIGKATSTFLSAAIPTTKYAVPLATKTLTQLRFGEREQVPGKEPKTLPELYQARTREVKEQVHVAPDGTYQMRPDARLKLASKFDGIRATDPKLADQLETKGAARIEYLATIMPRLPDFGVMQIGPDRRQVDDLKMRGWARAAAALEDPHAVLEAAAQGRVTPAAAAAIRAVYPELLKEFTSGVTSQLGSVSKRPHRDKLLALSILTGVPLDAAMTPGVQRVIQGMYASEPGTQGGTQAPTPQPAFGSVKAAPETQAQMRQGENT